MMTVIARRHWGEKNHGGVGGAGWARIYVDGGGTVVFGRESGLPQRALCQQRYIAEVPCTSGKWRREPGLGGPVRFHLSNRAGEGGGGRKGEGGGSGNRGNEEGTAEWSGSWDEPIWEVGRWACRLRARVREEGGWCVWARTPEGSASGRRLQTGRRVGAWMAA